MNWHGSLASILLRVDVPQRRASNAMLDSLSALDLWTNWTNIATMKMVNVHDAKTNFSRLLSTIEKDGQTIVICRNGEPVADLVPHKHLRRIKPDPFLSKIRIDYDPTEPMASDEWPEANR